MEKQKTLEKLAKEYYPDESKLMEMMERIAFKRGYTECEERMYSEEEVYEILAKFINDSPTVTFTWFQQFKKIKTMWYKLDKENNPMICDAFQDYLKWEEENVNQKKVKQDTIGEILVSTVFLSLDHSFGGEKPLLWETMIFGGEHDQYQDRYSSYEDALKGHQQALDLINNQENGE